MIYYGFNGYSGFKSRFGKTEHGDGSMTRRNRILLDFMKDRRMLKIAAETGDLRLLDIQNMTELRKVMMERIMRSGTEAGLPYEVNLMGYCFRSSKYSTDMYRGLCEDGDIRSCRYVNHSNGDRVFKMRAGRLIRQLILETEFGRALPESVLIYLQESFTQEWSSFAMSALPKNTLVVNDSFRDIYSRDMCSGDFHSCMTGRGLHTFYNDAVDASAASLRDSDGRIVARCVIFNRVHEEGSDRIWRLAERQYSTEQNDVLKRALVDALIKGGYIDGYKQVGFDCHNSRGFVDNEGNSLEDRKFWIDCELETYDTLSYQDSFKWYDISMRRAYNHQDNAYDYCLDTTEGSIDGDSDESYDEYHDTYGDFDTTTVIYHGREMSCSVDDLEDFIWIEADECYYHTDDVARCPRCGDWYVPDDGYYSEITGETYCCCDCMERADESYKEDNWYWSDWDEEFFEDSESLTEYMSWNTVESEYERRTISVDSAEKAEQRGELYLYMGEYYDDVDPEGKPYRTEVTHTAE